jgi:hypothetical protein
MFIGGFFVFRRDKKPPVGAGGHAVNYTIKSTNYQGIENVFT